MINSLKIRMAKGLGAWNKFACSLCAITSNNKLEVDLDEV